MINMKFIHAVIFDVNEYNELKEYGVQSFVTDAYAEDEDAKKEYGIDLIPLKDLKDMDAVIIGVAHDKYFELTKEDIGVVMDEVGIPECLTVKQVGNVMKNTFRNWDDTEYARLVQKLALPDKKQLPLQG